MKVNKKDFISSLFWMATGAGLCYGGYDLKLGQLHEPGPGFIFFWVGITMMGLSLIILLGAMQEKEKLKEKGEIFPATKWGKVISVPIALALYGYVFNLLGFILTTVMLLVYLFKAIEPQRWSVAIAGALITTLTAYVVFKVWLGCPLPKGPWVIG